MEPLRIEFTLRTPMVAPTHPIHLDSILANQVVVRNPEQPWEDIIHNLPLEKDYMGKKWVWKASALRINSNHQQQRMMVRRTSLDDIDYARNVLKGINCKNDKISTRSGSYRNYFLFKNLFNIEKAVAWCIGDPSEIEVLLSGVSGLGSMRRNGHGEVTSVSVIRDNRAHEHWKERVLPWPIKDTVPIISRHRSPYFMGEEQVCYAYPKIFT